MDSGRRAVVLDADVHDASVGVAKSDHGVNELVVRQSPQIALEFADEVFFLGNFAQASYKRLSMRGW